MPKRKKTRYIFDLKNISKPGRWVTTCFAAIALAFISTLSFIKDGMNTINMEGLILSAIGFLFLVLLTLKKQ